MLGDVLVRVTFSYRLGRCRARDSRPVSPLLVISSEKLCTLYLRLFTQFYFFSSVTKQYLVVHVSTDECAVEHSK